MKDEKELDDALNRLRSRNNPGTHKQS